MKSLKLSKFTLLHDIADHRLRKKTNSYPNIFNLVSHVDKIRYNIDLKIYTILYNQFNNK